MRTTPAVRRASASTRTRRSQPGTLSGCTASDRVLIVDWDYHHGNATQNAFYEDPTVLFFSAHDWRAYPGTGDPSLRGAREGTGLNINVHLDCAPR
jgi:acetoin utilization deacetylase AcuC-like enzyme